MTLPSLRDGFSVARMSARQRVENSLDLDRLFRVIDSDPAIVGAGVVYIDSDFNVLVLRDFQPICSVVPKKVVLREAPRYMAAQEFARVLETNPRESRIVTEAFNMAVSCSGAVLSWIVVFSGTALVPFSLGSSGVISSVGVAVALAGSAQCLIGGGRTALEVTSPDVNDMLDSNEWYDAVTTALDAVSLAGAAISLAGTLRMSRIIKGTTGKSMRQALSTLSRQERYQLTTELLRINHPGVATKMLRLRQFSKSLPKRFTPVEIRHGIKTQLIDALAGIAAVGGSVRSGNLNAIAMGIHEEVW